MSERLDIQDEQFWEWLHEQAIDAAKHLPENDWWQHLGQIGEAAYQLSMLCHVCKLNKTEPEDDGIYPQ